MFRIILLLSLAMQLLSCAQNFARVTEYGTEAQGSAAVANTQAGAAVGGCMVSLEGDPGQWSIVYDGQTCQARLEPGGARD